MVLDVQIGLKNNGKVVLDGKIGVKGNQKVVLDGFVGLKGRQKVFLNFSSRSKLRSTPKYRNWIEQLWVWKATSA